MAIMFLAISLIYIALAQFPVDVVPCPKSQIVAHTRSMQYGTTQLLYTNAGHILHLDDNHEVTVSADNGVSWKEVKGLPTGTKIRRMTTSIERHVLFLGFGESRRHWQSEDGGLTISQHVDTHAHLTGFEWHPTIKSWVLAISKPGCRNQPECSWDLYFSANGGSTWALLRTYVWDAAWHKGEGSVKQNIVVWERKLKSGNQFSWSAAAVVKSDSFFRTDETKLADDVLGFLCLENHIFIAKAAEGSRGFQLYSSIDMGEHFARVRFSEELDEKSYSILDVSEGSSFISVSHGQDWGHVYAGDASDNNFVLSLKNNIRSRAGARPVGTDFRPFRGLEGVYIANRWKTIAGNNGNILETVISFDKGGEWQTLKTKTGQKLNLLGPAEERGGFYSRAEAVGIMFSSGAIGEELSLPHDLFFTRDGGWTWTWTANGSHTYEIGNKGGLVVAAKDEEPSTSFQYSLTEGANWGDCPIFAVKDKDKKALLENIISDPHIKSRHFVTWGDTIDGGAVLSVLDFSKVHERECDGDHEDYERWEPSDRANDECLLGRHVVYKRRKQTAACFLPSDFDPRGEFVSNCSCTAENYICDFCFVREDKSDDCLFDSANPLCANLSPEKIGNLSCVPGQIVYTTKGYRKVPGDSCDPWRKGSVNLLPSNYTCGGDPNGPGAGGIFVLVLMTVILVTIAVLWWLAATNERVRAALATVIPENFLPDARSNLPSAQYSQLGGGADLEAFDSDARELPMENSESESDASATSP